MAEKFFITINTRNIDSERKTVYVHPKFTTVAKDPRIVFAISGKILLQADATEIFFILHQTLSPFFSLYLLDSDWLTSLLFYSQSFLGLSQVLPVSSLLCFFFFLCLISLPLVSCVSIPSYFPFLVTSFAFL